MRTHEFPWEGEYKRSPEWSESRLVWVLEWSRYADGGSTEREDWKVDAFWSQAENGYKGNSYESTRMTATKTPRNHGYIA